MFGLIGAAFSAVGSFISGAVSAIGSGIASFATTAFNIIKGLNVENLSGIINAIGQVITAIAQILGIVTEDTPEELGAKAMQSDKSLEDFDNDAEAYIKYLKEEIELDREKFDNMSETEKLGCSMIGISLETKAIEEKVGGIEISPECLGLIGKLSEKGIDIDPKDLLGIILSLKDAGITNLNDVVDLLEGKGDSDRIKTEEALAEALGENGDITVLDLKDAVRS